MTKFSKLLGPALGAMLAMGVAAPAQANYTDDPRQIRSELQQFERQLEQATYGGQLSEQNATWLSYRLRGARQQFRRFRRGGFDDWEMSTLNDTIDILHHELQRRSYRGGRRGYRGNRGYRQHDAYRGNRRGYYRRGDRYEDRRRSRGRYRD